MKFTKALATLRGTLLAMAATAALAGAAAFFGLRGNWRRQREPITL